MDAAGGPVISRRQLLAGGAAAGLVLVVRPLHPEAASTTQDRELLSGTGSAARSSEPYDTRAALGSEFDDDFDSELPGVTLHRWQALGGVTVFGRTRYGDSRSSGFLDTTDWLRGHGMVVALDASSSGNRLPGHIRTRERFLFEKGVGYVLEFDAGGSHRARDHGAVRNCVIARVPGVGATCRTSVLPTAGFGRVTLRFIPRATTTSTVELASGDAAGRAGVVIDNVRLRAA
jgi:hypothetical protein